MGWGRVILLLQRYMPLSRKLRADSVPATSEASRGGEKIALVVRIAVMLSPFLTSVMLRVTNDGTGKSIGRVVS